MKAVEKTEQTDFFQAPSHHPLTIDQSNTAMMTIGVDEAGRGPLFGPVYAAAVILPANYNLPNLNDSKKLTHIQRNILFEQIKAQSIYHIAYINVEAITRFNILNASLLAMQLAIWGVLLNLHKKNSSLNLRNPNILIDGTHTPQRLLNALPLKNYLLDDYQTWHSLHLFQPAHMKTVPQNEWESIYNQHLQTLNTIELPLFEENHNYQSNTSNPLYFLPRISELNYKAIKGGDGLHAEISAASILAKVARDQALKIADMHYPAYQLAQHKGYGTALHMAKIREHGITEQHRVDFLKFLDE